MISRVRHRGAVCALVGCLASGVAALAGQSSVEVRSPSAKLLDTAPGRILTASIVVANRGDQDDELVEHITLPPGCQKVAPPDLPFRLPAGGQVVRVLAVAMAPNMPAGRFELGYTVTSRRDPSSMGSMDLAIQVASVDNLEFVIEPQSAPVLAGDAYPVKLLVTNRGNTIVTIQLAHRSSLGFAVSTDVSSFDLGAGATREISCRVQTDKGFARHTNHAVTFDVTATTPSGKKLTASQASVVEVFPLVSGKRDPFHQLPMQLRLTGVAESEYAAQIQAELSGSGSLDEAGKHRVDFLFRGPDVQNASLFGERDEYGASYRGDQWHFDLGDRIYTLSPLTEKHSLGRGAGAAWHDDDTSTGMFYMTTRHRQQNSEEFGWYYRQEFTERFCLQGNFLRKIGGDSLSTWPPPQNIVTLQSHYKFKKHLDLEVEAGISRSDDGTMDHAYRAAAHGDLPGKVSYAIEHVHAGPDFHGYFTNTNTTYLSISKEVSKKLRLHAALSRYSGNAALNDVRSSVVNKENSWNAGANYQIAEDTELSLEWQHVGREDVLLPASYKFTEDSARLGIGHSFSKFQIQSFFALGTLDNAVSGEAGEFRRYSAVLNWRPDASQTYSVFANHGPSAFSGSSESSMNAGGSARWQFNEKLSANVSYARNAYNGLTGREQDQALASIQYKFANKSTLALVGRWLRGITKGTATAGAEETALMVTFSMPFNVPVSRKRSIGMIEGRLVDASSGSAAGLPRVVVQVGSQFAVTDEKGRFEFPSLKPGPCEVQIVRDSLGPHMAMVTPLPMNVTVHPAETTHVELTATAASAVSVTVKRFEFASGNSLTSSGPVKEAAGEEAAIVEITNGRDTWRTQTDRLGHALFDRLPGGPWSLRVASSDPSPLRIIENPERMLMLKPGESEQVTVRVLPLRRTLKMLDQGTIR